MTDRLSPSQFAWRRFYKNKGALAGLAFLIAAYSITIFAGFFSPYSPTKDEFRDQFFHPPTKLHFIDENRHFHLRPFVTGTHLIDRNKLLYASAPPLYVLYRKPDANANPYLPETIERQEPLIQVKDGSGKIVGTANLLQETDTNSGEFLAMIPIDPLQIKDTKSLRVETMEGSQTDLTIVNQSGKKISSYQASIERFPVKFFVTGASYTIFGIFRSNLHLFGVDLPGRIFVCGTDQSGRDIFSRVLFGAQISLSIGLVGVLLTTILGMIIGGIAGYYGGRTDQFLMRFAEVFMSIPALYFILTLRSAIPDRLEDSYDKVRELTAQTFAWQNSYASFSVVVAVSLLFASYYIYRSKSKREAFILSIVCLALLCAGNRLIALCLRAAQFLLPGSTRLTSGWTYFIMIFILSTIGWAAMSRVIRGMVLSLREREYVLAARALGSSDLRTLVLHILPNTLGYVIVRATLLIPAYILGEVALSFLGVGVQEPTPSWGNMLAAAQNLRVLQQFTWTLAPGIFLFLTVLAFNFFGDGLRDALDPKQRN